VNWASHKAALYLVLVSRKIGGGGDICVAYASACVRGSVRAWERAWACVKTRNLHVYLRQYVQIYARSVFYTHTKCVSCICSVT